MSVWEPVDDSGLGTGVVIDPERIDAFRMLESGGELEDHVLILTRTDTGGQVEYYAGYGWTKAGGIKNPGDWNSYLENFLQ